MSVYKHDELEEMYEGLCLRAVADCTLTTALVGGQPADDKGLEMFCRYQLHLDGDELSKAIERIKTQEIGESPAEDGGEIPEVESYGVNIVRHDPEDGCCYLGDWQVKACMKQAASRIGLFMAKKGTKGDLAEMGRIRAIGISLGSNPSMIRVVNEDGSLYVGRTFEKFMGRVRGPAGAKSIVHDSEVVPAGCRFAFELRVPRDRFTEEQIASIFACMQVIGVGSAKALERGKFKVNQVEISDAKRPKKEPAAESDETK